MIFLKSFGSYAELGKAWQKYEAYLASIATKLTPELLDFATADWHYNPRDHRSLHDSWMQRMIIREADGNEARPRQLAIELELLGPYHDGMTRLSYEGVVAYACSLSLVPKMPDTRSPHGDWLIDEVRLSDSGHVIHEVCFDSGAQLVIECRTFRHSTTIPAVIERPRLPT
jgi:hypothetical protein